MKKNKFEYQKDFDEEVFSILARVLKDAQILKKYTKEYIIFCCYNSRDRYKEDEEPEENILYWYNDIGEKDLFFRLLYKIRLFKSPIHEVLKRSKNYRTHLRAVCVDMSEDLYNYTDITPLEKMYFHELEEAFSEFAPSGGADIHTLERWEKIKERWHK